MLLCGWQHDSVGNKVQDWVLKVSRDNLCSRSMSASAQGDGNDLECVKIFSRNHVLKD